MTTDYSDDYDTMLGAYGDKAYPEGLAACERLDRSDSPHQAIARCNKLFYVPTLATLLAHDLEFSELTPATRPGWSRFNPSLANVNGVIYVNVRSANYRYSPNGYEWVDGVPNRIQTDNLLCDLSLSSLGWQAHWLHTFRSPDEEAGSVILGSEDLRIFADGQDQLYASCTMCLDSRMARQLVQVEVSREYKRLHPAKILNLVLDPDHCEKNWMPLLNNRLRHSGWVYQWWPHPVLLDSHANVWTIGPESLDAARHFRGGSQLLPLTFEGIDYRVGFIHEVSFFPGTQHRIYTHRLVALRDDDLTAHMSSPFWFSPSDPSPWRGLAGAAPPPPPPLPYGPEYCAGFCTDGQGGFLVSFGQDDAKAWVVGLSYKDLANLLGVTTSNRGSEVAL